MHSFTPTNARVCLIIVVDTCILGCLLQVACLFCFHEAGLPVFNIGCATCLCIFGVGPLPSPAAIAGIKVGDILISIEGKTLLGVTIDGLDKLFERFPCVFQLVVADSLSEPDR